jgi:two-component system sensor histidine kinase BarA
VDVSSPIIVGGAPVGRLRLIADTKDLPARLWSAVSVTAIGGLGGLLLALALAARLQNSITEPLRRLTGTMLRITDTRDYSVTVKPESRDEVGVLIAGFNTMIDDIHERDRRLQRHLEFLEQEVADRTRDYQTAAAEAQSANQAKSDFLATMSHEIRTPMNGIMVMAELLAGCDLPGRARRHADVITKSGQSLLAIINDILDLSKIEAGRLEVESLDVDPEEAAETVLRLFSERARVKGLDLVGRMELEPQALVAADPVRLGQVLSNLVNNALKFTEAGSVTLKVGPDPDDGGLVRFSIVDTGIGIAADKLDSIFDAFSQADQSTTRRFGGTGLGLAIGRKLVAAMGGTLTVGSAPGRGSTFSFALPRSNGASQRVAPRIAGPARRALVCLPGAATDASATLYLEEIGFDVTTAKLDAFPEAMTEADLVLTTPELLRRHRRSGLAADAVVAALADLATPADDLVNEGVAEFALSYPLSRSEIYEIGEWLQAARPMRAKTATATAETLSNFAGARVLVADDSSVNLEVAQSALARFGIAPRTVENGREAVEAHASAEWDLILMDGSMPELDGFEAAQAIREAERRQSRPRTPIVALTAHVVGAAAEQWRAADMDGVLHKPFTLHQLGEILRSALRGEIAIAPTETPSPAGEPLLDGAALDDLTEMSRDPSLVARIARLYCTTAPARIAELRDAIARADVKATASAAHGLKSMSLNIGAQAVAQLAAAIERDARETQGLADGSRIEALAQLAEQTYSALRERAA